MSTAHNVAGDFALTDLDWFWYLRISLDRGEAQIALPDQDAALDRWGAALNLNHVRTFSDRNISAMRRDDGTMRRRPGYDDLIDAVVNHPRPCGIASVDMDRLWRDDLQQRTDLLLMETQGALKLVMTPAGTTIEPDNEDSMLGAVILGGVARWQVLKLRKKQKERLVGKAERGEYHGSKRAWGYEHQVVEPVIDPATGEQAVTEKTGEPRFRRRGKLVVVPEEVEQIRDATRRLLAGESIRSIVLDWERRGIKTPSGKTWQIATLSHAIQSPRLAGLRGHTGHGVYPATDWDAIISVADHERLVAQFAARKQGPRPSTARKHLLSGMLRCGRIRDDGQVCGARLGVTVVKGIRRYACVTRGNGGCGANSVTAAYAEQTVLDKLVEHLDSGRLAQAIERERQAAAQANRDVAALVMGLDADRRRLAELRDERADGKLDGDEYRYMSTRVKDRIEQTERRLGQMQSASGPAFRWEGKGEELAADWIDMDLEERRLILSTWTQRIVVQVGTGPRNRWDPDRIDPVWRFG